MIINNLKKIVFDKTFISAIISGFLTYITVAMYANISADTYTFLFNSLNAKTKLAFGQPSRVFIEMISKFIGMNSLSPYFIFIISILFIAIGLKYISDIFYLKNDITKIFFGFSIILPVFNDYFCYLHDTIVYTFAFMLSCIGCYIFLNSKLRFRFFYSIILFTFSITIYQIFFQLIASIFLVDIILLTFEEKYSSVDIIKQSFIYLIVLLTTVFSYILITHIFGSSVHFYPNFIKSLIKIYGIPFIWIFRNHSAINFSIAQKISILLIYILSTFLFLKKIIKLSVYNKILCIFYLLLLPFSMNMIYIVYGQGMYRYIICMIFLILLPLLLIEITNFNFSKINKLLFLFLFIQLFFCFYNQQVRAYQGKLQEDSLLAYSTELVSSIRKTEGYKSSDKVAFIFMNGNEQIGNLSDYYVYDNPSRIDPENNPVYVSFDHVLKQFLSIKGAFNFNFLDDESTEKLKENSDIKNMSIYPDYGSIRIVDDIIVVRFN